LFTYPPISGTTILGYYQFTWEHDYLQAEDAYVDQSNALDKGAPLFDFGAVTELVGSIKPGSSESSFWGSCA
jgi:hypothetical protein